MWDAFSKILDVILAIVTAYFYFENRQLKQFKAEKELEIKKAELIKVKNEYAQYAPGMAGYYNSTGADINKRENEFNYKVRCLEVEIKTLEKIIKKYNSTWFTQ